MEARLWEKIGGCCFGILHGEYFNPFTVRFGMVHYLAGFGAFFASIAFGFVNYHHELFVRYASAGFVICNRDGFVILQMIFICRIDLAVLCKNSFFNTRRCLFFV